MTITPCPAFLLHLKSLWPDPVQTKSGSNPWYIVAAIGFAASNQPEAVQLVFQAALRDIDSEGRSQEERLLLTRRFRDALFKSGLISGYPKVINALKSLFDVTPEDLRDSKPLRDLNFSTSELTERGRSLFEKTYGEAAKPVQSLLDSIYPDMGWFSNDLAYGLVYSYLGVITPVETSYVMCSSLIATDMPLQIGWHLEGAMRHGATRQEVQAVRTMAMEVATQSGVVWRDEVPNIH